ncbi:MAG TPA: RHS repeat-associated core domain-containing protein [Sedimentisphaerales bacterium]|nr:RHS repeat-associated core domain-containing protein [Sedimentisphaerales bacterium]
MASWRPQTPTSNPYMFTGRRFDIETGLYYYRARYYNPHIGRFMQTDPVGYGDGINWYLYCGNNPLAFVDPTGLGAAQDAIPSPWPGDPVYYVEGGSVQIATGSYWALPDRAGGTLTPETADGYMLLGDLSKGIVKIGETVIPECPPTYIDELEKGYKAVGEDIGSAMWRPYIEVQDWTDLNNDGVVDRNNELSMPYWIEIDNIGSGNYKEGTYDATICWAPYRSWEAAADAAGTAVNWALTTWDTKVPNVTGAIPTNITPISRWLYDPSASPYLTGVRYYRWGDNPNE